MGEKQAHKGTAAVSRRTLLAGAVGGAVVGTTGSVADARSAGGAVGPASSEGAQAGPLRPVSMAMHIHGSFSEGIASYEAHLEQARQHDVDVIWWTDHDFRVAAHHHRRAVRFDGVTEDEDGLSWTWTERQHGSLDVARAEFVDQPRAADEPGRALRLTARGRDIGGALWFVGTAWNRTINVSLADTTIELDVLPESTGRGREVAIRLTLSYHPARGGRSAGQYALEYRIGGTPTLRHRREGRTGIVELPAPQGDWYRMRLRPVADIFAIWPDLVAEDNSLCGFQIGMRAYQDGEATAVVDRLRFDRGRGAGDQGMRLRRDVLDRYWREYMDVTHYESFEVSLVRHLNWIGGDLTMPELPSPPRRNNDPELTRAMIDFIHAHGGLAQWNHPLDVTGPDELARLMVTENALGADLVEIGRAPADELRWVFDTVARKAIFITGVGVSDDHRGVDWLDGRSNMITYVWAVSTESADLVEALRAGRAWWTDPARWRGHLALHVADRPAMGGVLVTTDEQVEVQITATDLPDKGELRILESPVDYAGSGNLAPAVRAEALPAAKASDQPLLRTVLPGTGKYLRLQVSDGGGKVVGESNPMWILREPPPHGIPPARQLTN